MIEGKKIEVKVNCNARINEVVKSGRGLIVNTTVKPEAGKANQKIIELIGRHYGLAKSKIKIIKGQRGKLKTIEILENV